MQESEDKSDPSRTPCATPPHVPASSPESDTGSGKGDNVEWLDHRHADPLDSGGSEVQRSGFVASVGDHIDLSAPFLRSYLADQGSEPVVARTVVEAEHPVAIQVPENVGWDTW